MQVLRRIKNFFHTFDLRRGQALVEMMMALSILVFGFLGMLSLLSQSLAINKTVADDYTATYLAGEGIEVMKNLIDFNANATSSACGLLGNGTLSCFNIVEGCYEIDYTTEVNNMRASFTPKPCNSDASFGFAQFLNTDINGFYGYAGGIPTPFKRIVELTIVPQSTSTAQEVQVNSYVRWIGRGNTQNDIDLEDHFMNWRT